MKKTNVNENTSFTVGSSILDRELKLAREFVCRRQPIVRLDVKGKEATITATDLDTALSRTFEIADGPAEAFAALVNAEDLGKIANACPGELMMISAAPDVIIRHREKAGESTYRLYAKPLSDFPTPPMPADAVFRIESNALLDGLRWATPACRNNWKYGLIFRQDENGVTIGATNGRAFATTGLIEATNLKEAEAPIVIPASTAERLIAVLEREEEIEVRAEGEIVSFHGAKWSMTATTGGSFPAVAWELVANEEKFYAMTSAMDLGKAVRAVVKVTKARDYVTLDLGKTGWTLSAEGAERKIAGKSNANLSLKIAVDCLRDWLKGVPKGDWVAVCANDTYTPTVWLCQSKPKAAWVIGGQRREARQLQEAA